MRFLVHEALIAGLVGGWLLRIAWVKWRRRLVLRSFLRSFDRQQQAVRDEWFT